jgi:hypothetical protein
LKDAVINDDDEDEGDEGDEGDKKKKSKRGGPTSPLLVRGANCI